MTGQPPKRASAPQKPTPAEQEKKKHNNERLDEALDETFPASDPLAMLEPVKRPGKDKAK